MSKEKSIKVTFKGEALERLEELRKSYCAPTTSDLVRDGIKVLATLQSLKAADGTITVTKGDKSYRIVMT